jgi:hypothetical protein
MHFTGTMCAGFEFGFLQYELSLASRPYCCSSQLRSYRAAKAARRPQNT